MVEDAISVGVDGVGGGVDEGEGSVGGEDYAEGVGGYGIGAGYVVL